MKGDESNCLSLLKLSLSLGANSESLHQVFHPRVLVEGQTYLFELRGACAGEGFGRCANMD